MRATYKQLGYTGTACDTLALPRQSIRQGCNENFAAQKSLLDQGGVDLHATTRGGITVANLHTCTADCTVAIKTMNMPPWFTVA